MKVGDIIEWRGVDRLHRARITESRNGEMLAVLKTGKTFLLNDLLLSKSLKVVGHE